MASKGILKRRAVLIDVDYNVTEKGTLVRLLLKGKRFFRLYDRYEPYFYLNAPKAAEKEILAIKAPSRERIVSPTKVERAKMHVRGRSTSFGKFTASARTTCPM